jgi:eukaryotic-like serine/threonine-protein kinase
MTDEFAFGPRFSIANRLGAGGMGVVYRAYDRERKGWVALKSVALADPTSVLRFKNEFRALSDVSHPNLVTLHELLSWSDKLFFTMELIEGSDLLSSLRAVPAIGLLDTLTDFDKGPPASPGRASGSALDPTRVRAVIGQLATGLSALHAAGKLHRDVKPSNVLVGRDGRVVLCDFGLVVDAMRDRASATDPQIVGTVEYMSPEQAAGAELTEASDWYSVGVILYELLVGFLPYRGARMKVLLDKQQFDPKPPQEIDPDVPADLAELAMAMLARDPTKRPSREHILRALGALGGATAPPSPSLASAQAPFIGREKLLGVLSTAFDDARRGHPVTVWVQGSSGMGKSQLVRRFLDLLAQRTPAIILQGRCYERDAVPYKAVDSIIDAMTRHLARLPRAEVEALLPRHVLALARVFPVLRRIPAVANAPQRRNAAPDPQEMRRRAFDALREWLARIGDRIPLVIAIDDMQWGDSDSAALLADLLAPPNPPALLLIISFRTEDAATSPALAVLGQNESTDRTQLDTRMITVGPLAAPDATILAHTLLGEATPERNEIARTIAAESGGIPFIIDELVRHAQSGIALRRSSLGRALKLEEVLSARIGTLSAAARHLLEIVAVAARPIELTTAAHAAQMSVDEERSLFGVLRAARLLRSGGARGREMIECYHDRVRETVVGLIDEATLCEHHAALASAYEAAEHPNVDALLTHYRGAGTVDRAAEYAARAADLAADALAFDRAAALYRLALELGDPNPTLRRRLGDALANAGNGAEAAAEYAAAAATATGSEAIDLRRRAAEQLLRCGRVEEGLRAARDVLAMVGLSLPQSRAWAVLLLFFGAIFLRLRGLGYRERDESELSGEERIRLDVGWTVTTSLGLVDTIRSVAFQRWLLRRVLATGETLRIARALSTEGMARGAEGDIQKTHELINAAEEIARKRESPYIRGWITLMRGSSSFLCGRWTDAYEGCTEAEQTFRDSCSGVTWEVANAQLFGLWACYHLGKLKELSNRLPRLLRAAQSRGDLYLHTGLRIGRTNIAWLVADDPDRARRELDEAMDKWPHTDIHIQHYYAMVAAAHIDLYRGRGSRALATVQELWPKLRSAFIFRIQISHVEGLHLLGRCALGAMDEYGTTPALMKIVKRSSAALRRRRTEWGDALALLLDAAVATREDRFADATVLLERAEQKLSSLSMNAWAAMARLRRGELLRDDELVAAAQQVVAAEGVRSQKRFANLMAPGFSRGKR